MSFALRIGSSKHGRNIALLAFVTAAVITACASEDVTDDGSGDPARGSDAGHDSAVDSGVTSHDAHFDTSTPPTDGAPSGDDAADATGETDANGGTDASDASADARADAAPDAAPDATPDAAHDAAPDVSVVDAADSAPPFDAGDDCQVTPLVCDGQMHNCDGILNKGCPNSITFGAPTLASPAWGGSGGSGFNDPCPAGQALVGVGGKVGGFIDQINAICAPVNVVEDSSTTPHTYSVSTGTTQALATHGLHATGTSFTATCAQGQVVVGIGGRSGNGLDAVILKCAPLLLTGSPGAFTVTPGAVTALPSQGGTGGNAFTDFACGANQVVRTMAGRAGDSIDQLSVICETVGVLLN